MRRENATWKPNRASLSAKLGFTVPTAFISCMRILYELAERDSLEVPGLFYEVFGLELAGEEARYQQTPPELFPFAQLGVDGVHYGYVIHAPELSPEDYPVGEMCPMDFDKGVFLVGNSTLDALENLASWQLNNVAQESTHRSEYTHAIIAEVSHAIGIEPHPEKAERRYGDDGNGLPVIPVVPSGWHFVPTSDGVGVLAPEDTFRPKHSDGIELREEFDRFTDVNQCIRRADRAYKDGYLGTALYLLRECYWHSWTDDDVAIRLNNRLVRVYEGLGRSVLSNMAERRVTRFYRGRLTS